jgi:hypothetical protein
VRIGHHFNPAFLRFFGELLLGVLVLAFGLEMLAVVRAKYRDLAVQPRWRGLLYWGIAIALALALLVWLLWRDAHRGQV